MPAVFLDSAVGERRAGFLSRVAQLLAARRRRHLVAELSPGHLRDVGLGAGRTRPEAAPPAWDVPVSWLR